MIVHCLPPQTIRDRTLLKIQKHVNQHMQDKVGIGKMKLGSDHNLFCNLVCSTFFIICGGFFYRNSYGGFCGKYKKYKSFLKLWTPTGNLKFSKILKNFKNLECSDISRRFHNFPYISTKIFIISRIIFQTSTRNIKFLVCFF